MLLSREAILGHNDLELELVPVPEWGGEVYVRGLTGAERDRLEAEVMSGKEADRYTNLSARLAAMTICDQDGKSLFTGKDVEALGRKSAQALRRVVEVAQRLSAVTEADVKELEKN